MEVEYHHRLDRSQDRTRILRDFVKFTARTSTDKLVSLRYCLTVLKHITDTGTFIGTNNRKEKREPSFYYTGRDIFCLFASTYIGMFVLSGNGNKQ